jgi:hypothetical protein
MSAKTGIALYAHELQIQKQSFVQGRLSAIGISTHAWP